MSNKTVKLAYGKINLSSASGTLASFKVSPGKGDTFKRESGVNSGKTGPGRRQYHECTAHPSIGGGFTSADVEHPDGTIIMLQGSRTRGKMRVADAVIFIRMRASAAFILVNFTLPTGPESFLGSNMTAFTGCGDILNPAQCQALGLALSRSFENNYMSPEEVDELFTVQTIRAQSSPAPAFAMVATSQGVELKAVAPSPVRRMRIRRQP